MRDASYIDSWSSFLSAQASDSREFRRRIDFACLKTMKTTKSKITGPD